MASTLLALKAQNESRLLEEKKVLERKRNLMILILNHCIENGYLNTAEQLQQEAGVSMSKFDAADNVDLSSIVQEFENYYEIKFGKKPKLVRRIGDGDASKSSQIGSKRAEADRRRKRNNYSSPHMPSCADTNKSVALKAAVAKTGADDPGSAGGKPPRRPRPRSGSKDEGYDSGGNNPDDGEESGGFGLVGSKAPTKSVRDGQQAPAAPAAKEDYMEQRMLKPLPGYDGDPDARALAATIQRDIFQSNPGVGWDDIVGLEDAKRLLKEAVVMPTRYPELFNGHLLSPWCGILLFGPPGTGKTMLAKAVASECRTTFFNISASSIVSKYRGDSEKLVRILFELARYHEPSTIFIDEMDALMGQRGASGGQGEHEASRRMKTELLIQMDGLSKGKEHVFLLAASNLPWELDMALLRRLEKRVLVTLPCADGRESLVRKLLTAEYCHVDQMDYPGVATRTDGFSGADLKLLCKEAAMAPVRRLMKDLEAMESSNESAGQGRALTAEQQAQVKVQVGKITAEDMDGALSRTKPTAKGYEKKYMEWQAAYGST
jgi:katanin p60 ATPase-containing subunit A1